MIEFLSGKTATDRERSKTRAVDQQPSCHRSTRAALRGRKRVIDKLLSLDESHWWFRAKETDVQGAPIGVLFSTTDATGTSRNCARRHTVNYDPR